MFDFSGGKWPVSQDLADVFTRTFSDIASPGNGWSGAERIAIANATRYGPDSSVLEVIPQQAVDAAALIATDPAGSTESSVRETISALGETRYVEIVGVAAAMTGVDTITRLLGFGVEPLPEPRPGDAVADGNHPRLKRRSAWVAMDGPAKPRHALSAAPRTQATMNRLMDRLYMTGEEIGGTSEVRGLSREQMEILILKVSHSNECFW